MKNDPQDPFPYEPRYTMYWRDDEGRNWLSVGGAARPVSGRPIPAGWHRIEFVTDETTMAKDPSDKIREYDRDQPVALDDRDPSNTDPSELTSPLDPDDDVYSLIRPEQGDRRETTPAADWEHDDGRQR